jgi:uncharacterized phiE125 gp8 family phage protein
MSLQVIVPPTEEPVTLEEARASSATGYPDVSDAQLLGMIKSARIRLERYLGRAIAEQTLALHLPCFPYGGIVLTWASPLQTIEDFSYRPYGGGAIIGLEEDIDYLVDPYAEPAIVYPVGSGAWPTTAPHPSALSVTYVAGWPPDEVPEPIKGAILGEIAIGAASLSAGATGGDIRSLAIDGLGTITYQSGTTAAAGGGDAMLQPMTRTLVDSYRIAWA